MILDAIASMTLLYKDGIDCYHLVQTVTGANLGPAVGPGKEPVAVQPLLFHNPTKIMTSHSQTDLIIFVAALIFLTTLGAFALFYRRMTRDVKAVESPGSFAFDETKTVYLGSAPVGKTSAAIDVNLQTIV